MILVIIDHLSAMVHLVPTKQDYRTKDITEILFDRVYKHHGMPRLIISDRDSLFTSLFWCRLHQLIGSELRLSLAYHPQTDGLTEHTNQMTTQMIRSCVALNQQDWAVKLCGIEFVINYARSETNGVMPFMLNIRRMPRSIIWETNSEYSGVRVFMQKMKNAIMCAHDLIITT